MKKIIFSFFAVLLITGCTPPKEEIDVAKEEEAIKAMLKKEMTLYWDGDYIAESELWVKEDYLTTVMTNGNKHGQGHGWDSIYAYIKKAAESDLRSDVTNMKVEFKDLNIKVYDNVAWAVYYLHNTWEYKGEPFDGNSVRATFLEKVDNNWKLALNFTSTLNPCETEDEDEDEDDDE